MRIALVLATYAAMVAGFMWLAHRYELATHASVFTADADRLDRVLAADGEHLNFHAAIANRDQDRDHA